MGFFLPPWVNFTHTWVTFSYHFLNEKYFFLILWFFLSRRIRCIESLWETSLLIIQEWNIKVHKLQIFYQIKGEFPQRKRANWKTPAIRKSGVCLISHRMKYTGVYEFSVYVYVRGYTHTQCSHMFLPKVFFCVYIFCTFFSVGI